VDRDAVASAGVTRDGAGVGALDGADVGAGVALDGAGVGASAISPIRRRDDSKTCAAFLVVEGVELVVVAGTGGTVVDGGGMVGAIGGTLVTTGTNSPVGGGIIVSITLAASSEERKRALAKASCTSASMEACGMVDAYLAVTCMVAAISA